MMLQGRKIYPGVVQGETLVTSQGISFYGGVDPESGLVLERGHELEGQSIGGKVLVFPTGKGSTVGSYTLYRLKSKGLAPLAIVNSECETVTAVGCIIAEIPCVDHIDLGGLKSGQIVAVNGEAGTVQILAPAAPPPPLRGSEQGTFTEHTLSKRLPDIARRTATEADLSPEARKRLEALAEDMPAGRIREILDPDAPDADLWPGWIAPLLDQTWLEAPWFPAELYFFRRMLEASGYFQTGLDRGVDPYRKQKLESLSGLTAQLELVCSSLQESSGEAPAEALTRLLHTLIWGNQADLSIWPAGSHQPANHAGDERSAHLLSDQARQAVEFMLSRAGGLKRVDFILDNVGLELAYDLLLADQLLGRGLTNQVIFHAKPFPTYVSDATIPDIQELVEHLVQADEDLVRSLGLRLRQHLAQKRLSLKSEYYWISPLLGWEMPQDMRSELSGADLLISKGDANYRRWVGDRHWPFTYPLEEIVAYRPTSLLLIRVLKSELVVGLPSHLPQEIARKDPDWLFNGSWGLIQFVK
jgi:predicted aconitase with swiveling domain/uncharacterized protein with ATP-grasp and redox domains